MNQPRNTAVTEAIEKLGLEACKAELLAFDESLPIEVRADHYIRAQDLRAEQVAMLEPYPLSNVLGQGPNVSHRPAPVEPCAWVGVRVGLILDAALVIACAGAYALWASRATLLKFMWRLFV